MSDNSPDKVDVAIFALSSHEEVVLNKPDRKHQRPRFAPEKRSTNLETTIRAGMPRKLFASGNRSSVTLFQMPPGINSKSVGYLCLKTRSACARCGIQSSPRTLGK